MPENNVGNAHHFSSCSPSSAQTNVIIKPV